jgi:hypothetical protein
MATIVMLSAPVSLYRSRPLSLDVTNLHECNICVPNDWNIIAIGNLERCCSLPTETSSCHSGLADTNVTRFRTVRSRRRLKTHT